MVITGVVEGIQTRGRAGVRPATQQPVGGNGIVLTDGAGASAREMSASSEGPTAGMRGTAQSAARQRLLNEARAQHQGTGPVLSLLALWSGDYRSSECPCGP
jgi:hypothetical protein